MSGLIGGLAAVLILLVLRLLLRREWLAAPAFVAMHSLQPALLSGAGLGLMLPVCMFFIGLPVYAALRVGVLAGVTAVMVAEALISQPVMLSLAHWGADVTWMLLVLMGGATTYAFRTARGPAPGAVSPP